MPFRHSLEAPLYSALQLTMRYYLAHIAFTTLLALSACAAPDIISTPAIISKRAEAEVTSTSTTSVVFPTCPPPPRWVSGEFKCL